MSNGFFAKKKQKHCRDEETHEAGDLWDHTAVAADSKLLVSLVVGKRTKPQTQQLVCDTQKRLRKGHLPAIFSDGYEGYEGAILEAFGRRYPVAKSGGQKRPRRPVVRWAQGLAYGQVVKGGQGIELRVIRGKARLLHTLYLLGYQKINTSVVERHNGTSRLRNQRKVRRTLAFSKSRRYHEWMSWLSVVDQRRKRDSPSNAGDGIGTDRSYLVDSRLASVPCLRRAGMIAGHDRFVAISVLCISIIKQ